jgi:hypothetical protein
LALPRSRKKPRMKATGAILRTARR